MYAVYNKYGLEGALGMIVAITPTRCQGTNTLILDTCFSSVRVSVLDIRHLWWFFRPVEATNLYFQAFLL